MRLSDADREELFRRLSAHAAGGRLELSELERRVAALSEARTRDEAHALLADLPALESDPAPKPARFRRGHADADAPAADWRPTSERFRDPKTGRVMRVWEDADGRRHYVADERG